MDPLGFHAAMSVTRRDVLSAQPDAPVLSDGREPRPARRHRVRRALARGLHRMADRVEPCLGPQPCGPQWR